MRDGLRSRHVAPFARHPHTLGQFRRAAPDDVESLIFWVGGVPQEQLDKAAAGEGSLPSLHSPFWAPDAKKVIATGAEGLASAALTLMPARGG